MYSSHHFKSMHSYIYDYCPKTFKGTWKLNKDMNTCNTRARDDFYMERITMAYFDNHPLYKFPKLWNNLETHLKRIPDKISFLRELKRSLINKI